MPGIQWAAFNGVNMTRVFTAAACCLVPLTLEIGCLDVTSTYASSTGDNDPNGTSSEHFNPKMF